MEYIYASLLLHKAGKEITETSVKKVLEAAGVKVDDARVKALISSLDGVDIEKAISTQASMAQVVQAAPDQKSHVIADTKPEKSAEDHKKDEEQAAAGLGSLFG